MYRISVSVYKINIYLNHSMFECDTSSILHRIIIFILATTASSSDITTINLLMNSLVAYMQAVYCGPWALGTHNYVCCHITQTCVVTIKYIPFF